MSVHPTHPLQPKFSATIRDPEENANALKAFATANQWGTVPLTLNDKKYLCVVTNTGSNNVSCVPLDNKLTMDCFHAKATGPLPSVEGLTCTMMPDAFKNSQ
jgi:hypothetical protein